MSEASNSEQRQQQANFSFGKRLASARGALNLSRREVAKELRLGLAIITALEEEDYEQLAVPIFVNGYLRNYARLLKIPVEPLLAAYGQVQVEVPALISNAAKGPKPSHNKLLLRIASICIVLILVTGIVSWLQQQDFEFPTVASLNEASVATSVAPQVTLPLLPEVNELAEVKELTEVNELPELLAANEIAVEEIVEVIPTPPPVPVVVELPANRVLIRVSEESWVEVSDNDGKRLIYDLLRVDKEYRVSGRSPFKVFLGNAKAVRIEYNGESVNVKQHIRGNLARFKLGVTGE